MEIFVRSVILLAISLSLISGWLEWRWRARKNKCKRDLLINLIFGVNGAGAVVLTCNAFWRHGWADGTVIVIFATTWVLLNLWFRHAGRIASRIQRGELHQWLNEGTAENKLQLVALVFFFSALVVVLSAEKKHQPKKTTAEIMAEIDRDIASRSHHEEFTVDHFHYKYPAELGLSESTSFDTWEVDMKTLELAPRQRDLVELDSQTAWRDYKAGDYVDCLKDLARMSAIIPEYQGSQYLTRSCLAGLDGSKEWGLSGPLDWPRVRTEDRPWYRKPAAQILVPPPPSLPPPPPLGY